MEQPLSAELNDLRRGAAMNVVGHAVRVLQPVLLVIVTRLYGVSSWGLLVAGQAVVYLAARVCLWGLERAMAYWVPHALAEGSLRGWSAVTLRVALMAAVLSIFGVTVAAPLCAELWGAPHAASSFAIMSLAVLPLSLSELAIGATMGCRRIEGQVLVRDTLVPLVALALAIALYASGVRRDGLAWSFVLSEVLGVAAAMLVLRRVLGGIALPRETVSRLPRELERYARPLGWAEIATTLLRRVDTLIVALFGGPTAAGIYGIVLQFGNTVRSLKGSLEPVVIAVIASTCSGGEHHAPPRRALSHSFAYATALVVVKQAPVVAAIIAFQRWLLPLFGVEPESAAMAVQISCAGWLAHSTIGLAAQVVSGVGSSKATLTAVLITLGLQLVLLLLFVPRFGPNGAAAAVALASVVHGAVSLLQMRLFAGTWGYDIDLTLTVLSAWVALAALPITVALSASLVGLSWAHVLGLAAFLVIFMPRAVRTWRSTSSVKVAAVATGGSQR